MAEPGLKVRNPGGSPDLIQMDPGISDPVQAQQNPAMKAPEE